MSWLSKAWGDVTGKTARKKAEATAAQQQANYAATKRKLLEEEAKIEEQRKREKGKIEAKKIRSLRRGYRAPGFLQAPSDEVSEKLG